MSTAHEDKDDSISLPGDFEETLAALLAVPKPKEEDQEGRDTDDEGQATADSEGSS